MLRDLSNDTRGTSCGRHDVRERLERAESFTVGRRRFTVVDILAAGSVLGVAWERRFGLCDGVGCGRRGWFGERRCGCEGRRRVALCSLFTGLVAVLVGGLGREVE
jgi:hypothetical protein